MNKKEQAYICAFRLGKKFGRAEAIIELELTRDHIKHLLRQEYGSELGDIVGETIEQFADIAAENIRRMNENQQKTEQMCED